MKALMLAAGISRRLYGDENDELPKALLRFDDQSLLQRHIELLQAYGVKELVMIVGHRQEDLIAEAGTVAHEGFVRPIFNPRYKEGPLLSMAKGIEVLRGGTDVLFMNADVLYHPLVLEKLITSRHRNCFIMDRQFQSTKDQVTVCLNSGEVIDFGKGLGDDFELFGEWPGFLKISPEIAAKVADRTECFIDCDDIKGPYEQVFRQVLKGEPRGTFSIEDVTGIPWIEIDYPEDLEKANRKTFPRISEYLVEITVVEAPPEATETANGNILPFRQPG